MHLRRDLRYAVRQARRHPGFAATVVGTLAVGVGATVATFTVADAVLFRPLPYPDADRLVAIWERRAARGTDRLNAAPANFEVWREQAGAFDGMAAYTPATAVLTGAEEPARVSVARVTRGFFEILGTAVRPGRTFLSSEHAPGGDRVAVLDHGFWTRRFGADPDVVGRAIRVDGQELTVVGVARVDPALLALRGPDAARVGVDVWTPLALGAPGGGNPIGHWLTAFGRLREGASLESAQAEMEAIAARLARERPDTNEDWTVRLEPLRPAIVGDTRPLLLLAGGAALLVLVVACTNAGNLLLMRGLDRRHELAVRGCLGAGPRALVRQLLTESMVFATLACGAGLVLAMGGSSLLASHGLGDFLPRGGSYEIDGRVVWFAVGLALATGLLTGTWPALRAARARPATPLKEGRGSGRASPTNRSVGAALAVVQVALCVVLLAGGGLLLRSLWRLQDVDPGFEASDGVVALDLQLPRWRYPERRSVESFFGSALQRVEDVPGVAASGAITRLPLDAEGWCGTFVPLDRLPPDPADAPCAEYRSVRGDYFRAMGIPIVRGRGLSESDDADAPRVVVIGRSMAERFWPASDPLGRRIAWGDTFEIVGIAGDVKHFGLAEPAPPQFYASQMQDPNTDEVRDMTLVLRTERPLESVLPAVRGAIREIDAGLPLDAVRSMDELRGRSIAVPRVRATLFLAFAGVTLLLALMGTYAVLGYFVSGTRQEMGIRLALGAPRRRILGLVLRRGALLTGAGLTLGVLLALPATDALARFLFEVPPRDPATLIGLVALLFLTGAAASLVPAIRAARVDPAAVLRQE